ncbi:hypothetical protein COT87_01015 [Candidatus Collierbacteria bacterium CG10_big_fil_rev_8_21_14_0_10_44_9]|uniref:HAD family hydrolase n=1 Tax=Candidatus Collierbacteria bacterium CG10_big_fil_rev_8_21_14_0_10_44_9 TaxID=1974535 RepID=A0A2H0VLF4_9BACT|nr:MAG: hypothetical protein COT87_01015 [Candidatus Collierbacteria bacterium CG10_big_fil_rev_8_21_14_0_10_44_9]
MSLYTGVESGGYQMVHYNGQEAIWCDPINRAKVVESYTHDNYPFSLLLTDFDNFLVDTESKGKFFDHVWGLTFQEAGMEATVEELTDLRWKVYEWQSDVVTSTQAMMQRIAVSRDKFGNVLSSHDTNQLSLLMSKRVRDKFRSTLDDKFRNTDDPGVLLAERKEKLGAELLIKEPRLVLELASLMPGVLEFLEATPNEVILAIVSAGRRATLEQIMRAYSQVLPSFSQRFTGMLFGEEDGDGYTKPSEGFINSVRWHLAHKLHDECRIPRDGISIHDTLMLGDKALDTPGNRGGMHHITVGKYPGHLGPLTSHANSLYDLLRKIKDPQILRDDFTLRRLSYTFRS